MENPEQLLDDYVDWLSRNKMVAIRTGASLMHFVRFKDIRDGVQEYIKEKSAMHHEQPMEITGAQRDYLMHMLGYQPPLSRNRIGSRNFYCTEVGGKEEAELMEMAEMGLVKRAYTINEGEDVYFFATESGMDAVGLTAEEKSRALIKRDKSQLPL